MASFTYRSRLMHRPILFLLLRKRLRRVLRCFPVSVDRQGYRQPPVPCSQGGSLTTDQETAPELFLYASALAICIGELVDTSGNNQAQNFCTGQARCVFW